MILEFKTYVNGQRVSIELDRIVSGQVEFNISIGDFTVTDSLKDEHGFCIDQAKLLLDKMIKAGFDKYYSGLKYLYYFLEVYEALDNEHDD